MPVIKPSSDLRNNYSDISAYCHETKEPVYLTKNGHGDLAVVSIDAFGEMFAHWELYRALKAGIDEMKSHQGTVAAEVFESVDNQLYANV